MGFTHQREPLNKVCQGLLHSDIIYSIPPPGTHPFRCYLQLPSNMERKWVLGRFGVHSVESLTAHSSPQRVASLALLLDS